MQIYPPGTKIGGQYEIVSRPMMGGMGVVYFCLDHDNDRPVALKTFKPEYLPDRAARDRFLREGTAWVQLGRHPHIVRCYKVEYIDPTAFLVLELIAKEQGVDDASLRPWLGAPMLVEQALLFALQIARGMKHATDKIPGFVHRDLKPENVLIGTDKLPGTNVNRLRVTDFGLAIILKDEVGSLKDEEGLETIRHTHLTHGIVGTPLYMAPEQWVGEPVGVYTDVYALGCILYEMLTGQRAASGSSISQLQTAHCNGNLRPLPKDLSDVLKEFLMQCLALSPTERFHSWQDVTDALKQAYIMITGHQVPSEIAEGQDTAIEQLEVGLSYESIGISYFHMGKFDIARNYFEKILLMAQAEETLQALKANALGFLGNIHRDQGDSYQALAYFEEAITISREIKDRSGEIQNLANRGVLYKNLGDWENAITNYELALKYAQETGNEEWEEITLGNLGVVYRNMGDQSQGIKYLELALPISQKIGNRRREGSNLGNLGTCYMQLEDTKKALIYLEQALMITREIGDRRGEALTLSNLGNLYRILNDNQQAIRYIEQGSAICREIGDINTLATSFYVMALIYQEDGDITRALSLAQEAEQILAESGNPIAGRVGELVAELQDSNTSETELAQEAFDAFQNADNPAAMKVIVGQYSILKDEQFIHTIEEIISEEVEPEYKPAFEQRLSWLKQIAGSK